MTPAAEFRIIDLRRLAVAVWTDRCHGHPDAIQLATQVLHIRRARDEGRLALLCGLQNAECIERDLERLRTLRRLGVRIVQLTYNARNQIGDGCRETDDRGLSVFGRDVVRPTTSCAPSPIPGASSASSVCRCSCAAGGPTRYTTCSTILSTSPP